MAGQPYQILRSQTEHAVFLTEAIRSHAITKLQLASFGLWAGINNDGSVSAFSPDNPVANVLTLAEAEGIRTEIVVGIPPFSSRAGYKAPPCIYCADAHRRMLQRIFQCRKQWPETFWYYHRQSHTKLAIGWNKTTPLWAVTGGHNLADSSLEDFSIVLENAGTIFAPIFEELKSQSDPDISEIRIQFEDVVKNAASPEPPAIPKTQDGTKASSGIFQKPTGPNPIPTIERTVPPAQDVIDLLMALSRKQFLQKEEFTRVSRSAAWMIDQNAGLLRPTAKEIFKDDHAVIEAEQLYHSFILSGAKFRG